MSEKLFFDVMAVYTDPEIPMSKKDVDNAWHEAAWTVPGFCQACDMIAIARRRRADGKWTCRACFG